jgi:GNAT superfamily N-acetyltransferase
MLRRLTLDDMDGAARIHRAALDDTLPWLPRLHTPEDDRAYFRGRVFADCTVWGVLDQARVVGFIAFREDWIDHLYVSPGAQGHGHGSALLAVAKAAHPRLHLWTFQRNLRARGFYERRGFVLVEETDGAANAEREPDALYLWSR